MRIVTRTRLLQFSARHPAASGPMRVWEAAVKAAKWASPSDVKGTFRNADWVQGLWVFDVNRYRIVADVQYERLSRQERMIPGVVYIKEVMTHPEYDLWSQAIRRRGKA
jgi:mRNA interferase HigB